MVAVTVAYVLMIVGFIGGLATLGALVSPGSFGIPTRKAAVLGLVGCWIALFVGTSLLPDDFMEERGDRAQPNASETMSYRIVRNETYTANADGRFFPGKKIHVKIQSGTGVEAIAKQLASNSGATTIFFWRESQEVGKEMALYGVEYIDGRQKEVLVDTR